MSERLDPHQKTYVCTHVFYGNAPVLLVSRPDGDWCFLCGAAHDDSAAQYRVVGIGHLFEHDQTLIELENLPVDWEAERTIVGGQWLLTRVSPSG